MVIYGNTLTHEGDGNTWQVQFIASLCNAKCGFNINIENNESY